MKQRKRLYKKIADMHHDINEMEDSEKIIWLQSKKIIVFIGSAIEFIQQ